MYPLRYGNVVSNKNAFYICSVIENEKRYEYAARISVDSFFSIKRVVFRLTEKRVLFYLLQVNNDKQYKLKKTPNLPFVSNVPRTRVSAIDIWNYV